MSVYISVFFLNAAQFLAYLRFQRLYLSFAMYDLVFIIHPPYFACPSGGGGPMHVADGEEMLGVMINK
jgi:hypothetical protein